MADYDFAQQYSLFTFNSFLIKAELISSIVKVKAECQRILRFNLFNTAPTKVLRPEEFEQLQTQAFSSTATSLKDGWLLSLKNGIKNSLKEVGKGWFNLNEKRQEVYEISKLKKFMAMINFMMQDTLRFLVEASLEKFTSPRTHALAHAHTHTHTHARTRASMCTHIHAHSHAFPHMCAPMRGHIHAPACIRAARTRRWSGTHSSSRCLRRIK